MAWIAQQLLTAINAQRDRDCITEMDLVMRSLLTAKQVEQAALTLRRNGLIEKTGKGCHTLTAAGKKMLDAGKTALTSGPKGGGQTGKRVRKMSLRIGIWRAFRIRRKLSVPEIIALVVDGSERGDVTSNVQKYVSALAKAGYLIEMPRREPGTALTSNGFKRWWLADGKDTGPKAPVWRAARGSVYDPNTETETNIRGVLV